MHQTSLYLALSLLLSSLVSGATLYPLADLHAPSGCQIEDGIPLDMGLITDADLPYLQFRNKETGSVASNQLRVLSYHPDNSIRAIFLTTPGVPHGGHHILERVSQTVRRLSPPLLPPTPKPYQLEQLINAQVIDGAGTTYRLKLEKIDTIESGPYRAHYRAYGYMIDQAGKKYTWMSLEFILRPQATPGVIEIWASHSNMQPRSDHTDPLNFPHAGHYILRKRGTLTIASSSFSSAPNSRFFMEPKWSANYPLVTSSKIIPYQNSYFPDAVRQVIRFYATIPGSPYDFQTKKHLPCKLRPRFPRRIKGYHAVDGLLAVDTPLASTPPNSTPRQTTLLARDNPTDNTHNVGYPYMAPAYDLPQLLGQGNDSYVDDLFRFAASKAERPVQRGYPDLDQPSVWREWRHNPLYDDRYEEGSVNMRAAVTARPNPDYQSMRLAPDLRTLPINGFDHEHVTITAEYQAYLRSGLHLFKENITATAENGLSIKTFNASAPAHSERSAAFGIHVYRAASYVGDTADERRKFHKVAIKMWDKLLEFAGLVRNQETGAFYQTCPQNLCLRSLFGWNHGAGFTSSAAWMAGQTIQAITALGNDEKAWQKAGFPTESKYGDAIFNESKLVIYDTFLFWKKWYYDALNDTGFVYKVNPYTGIPTEGYNYAWNSSRKWSALGSASVLAASEWYIIPQTDPIHPFLVHITKEFAAAEMRDTNNKGAYNPWFQSTFRAVEAFSLEP